MHINVNIFVKTEKWKKKNPTETWAKEINRQLLKRFKMPLKNIKRCV